MCVFMYILFNPLLLLLPSNFRVLDSTKLLILHRFQFTLFNLNIIRNKQKKEELKEKQKKNNNKKRRQRSTLTNADYLTQFFNKTKH